MVQGRLVSTGRLADLAFEVQGWELVVSGADGRALASLGLDAVTTAVDGRHLVELPVDRSPDQVLPELSRLHVQVVSLTPRHESLEDYFMRLVARRQAPAA